MNPHELPVYQQKDKILEALASNQVVVVESPTGSGKTTQLPIILHEAGYDKNGILGVTQPRRIAALSVSDYIAQQLGTKIPGLVGYKMRFEDQTNEETRIKIMTDGILLQEMKLDPYLSRYGVIIVDEAHERSLNIDFILGLLKKVIEVRPEFKVIISSATINAEVFSEYFGECPIVKIETQAFPVTVIYDPIVEVGQTTNGTGSNSADGSVNNQASHADKVMSGDSIGRLRYSDEALYEKIISVIGRVLTSRRQGESGDILVFLPGEKTIKECWQRLADSNFYDQLQVIPLYARLGKDEQEKIFYPAPPGKTKVVIATNIAETSVTIDGITVVIDSGLAKLNYYNPKTFTSSLIEVPISKASCNQRKGRAGRTRPGVCYRLYPRKEFESRPLFTTEEIYRTDLSEVVLRMAELGITDFEDFDFISKPPKAGIMGAIDVLNLLDALTPERDLSEIGKMMCEFPLLPRLSRMIVEAIMRYPDVIHEVLVAAAFLSTMSPYVLPPGLEMEARKAHHAFRDPLGDFVSYLHIYDQFVGAQDKRRFCEKNFLDERTLYEIVRINEQLEVTVSEMGIPIGKGGSLYDYLCAISRGLIQFVCARQERGLYRSLTAEKIQIHPGSVMFRENPDFIVAGEIVRTTRMYAMSVSPLPRELLKRISPLVAQGLLGSGAGRRKEEKAVTVKPSGRTRVKVTEIANEPSERLISKASMGEKAQGQPIDLTNTIQIGGFTFTVTGRGKKRRVLLDWESFKKARANLETESSTPYKSLTATVVYQNYELLAGEKLSTIIRIAKWLEPERDLSRDWPRGQNFEVFSVPAEESNSPSSQPQINLGVLNSLINELEHVLQIAVPKEKSKDKQNTRQLGFVTLYTDGNGVFWFRISRGFHTALNETIASLESLADAAADGSISRENRERIGQLYRKLDSVFE
ncbi:MAG TPA: ATP-dependent RNA helicase [Spirochaetales bacterium]|nr:ATP-dependent RNA helicase [Spirochaetales bacterium]HPS15190.1 ATP-dependent RNA helicase [Spirochaetales bacterium]